MTSIICAEFTVFFLLVYFCLIIEGHQCFFYYGFPQYALDSPNISRHMTCGHTHLGNAGLNSIKWAAFLQDFSEPLVILLLLSVGNHQEEKGESNIFHCVSQEEPCLWLMFCKT